MVFAEPTMGRRNTPSVEKVAATILQDCLVEDGSLLTPGAPVAVSKDRVGALPAVSTAARQLYEIDILYLLSRTF